MYISIYLTLFLNILEEEKITKLVMENITLKLNRHLKRPCVEKYDFQRLKNTNTRADSAIKVRQCLTSKEVVGAEQLAAVLNDAASNVIPKGDKVY